MTTLQMTYQDGNENLKPGDSVMQIFMNEQKTLVVKQFSVRRGGCLFAGTITMTDRVAGRTVEIDSTSGPYCPNSPLIADKDESHLEYLHSLTIKHLVF